MHPQHNTTNPYCEPIYDLSLFKRDMEQDYMFTDDQVFLLAQVYYPPADYPPTVESFSNHSSTASSPEMMEHNFQSYLSPALVEPDFFPVVDLDRFLYADHTDTIFHGNGDIFDILPTRSSYSTSCTPSSSPASSTIHHPKKSNDARPYPCKSCKRAFARKHDLQRHERVHSGDKPYVCPCCKKAFARTDALKRHLRMEEHCRGSQEVQAMKETGRRRFRNL
ncbi:uncharacterized protein EV154DRAFT_525762 [Mucor mucedo]|uniref:uncharacterized protein n=1 Tax=Mucor mucedo TaxID=29922 RepID=UPI002220FEA2|nr:uncharacterized protein EV154DRAFT_525762 [Mucor mucedo]KAI7876624.1 hypothetical protein EV154DRAFT_525762 [Mucor mucedo]